jgi:hypothetical protein
MRQRTNIKKNMKWILNCGARGRGISYGKSCIKRVGGLGRFIGLRFCFVLFKDDWDYGEGKEGKDLRGSIRWGSFQSTVEIGRQLGGT